MELTNAIFAKADEQHGDAIGRVSNMKVGTVAYYAKARIEQAPAGAAHTGVPAAGSQSSAPQPDAFASAACEPEAAAIPSHLSLEKPAVPRAALDKTIRVQVIDFRRGLPLVGANAGGPKASSSSSSSSSTAAGAARPPLRTIGTLTKTAKAKPLVPTDAVHGVNASVQGAANALVLHALVADRGFVGGTCVYLRLPGGSQGNEAAPRGRVALFALPPGQVLTLHAAASGLCPTLDQPDTAREAREAGLRWLSKHACR